MNTSVEVSQGGMETGIEQIPLIVIGANPRGAQCSANLKRWFMEQGSRCRGLGSVAFVCVRDIPSAMSLVWKEGLNDPIFVTLGIPADEVRAKLSPERLALTIIVVESAQPSQSAAPVLGKSPTVAVSDAPEAVRKMCLQRKLRNGMTIRAINGDEDFRSYFALRYSVWSKLGYVQGESDCPASRWEVDFADQSARAFGAFSQTGELVGCVRLVFDRDETPCLDALRRLIVATGDAKLLSNFERPKALSHPFKELDSFPNFLRVYQDWVRRRVSKAEVGRVIVKEEFRKNGLGEVLVDFAVAAGYDSGVQLLFLACSRCHLSFYQRCGFRPIKDPVNPATELSCEHFGQINVPSVAMQRWLR